LIKNPSSHFRFTINIPVIANQSEGGAAKTDGNVEAGEIEPEDRRHALDNAVAGVEDAVAALRGVLGRRRGYDSAGGRACGSKSL
jgi:hypothetical protein